MALSIRKGRSTLGALALGAAFMAAILSGDEEQHCGAQPGIPEWMPIPLFTPATICWKESACALACRVETLGSPKGRAQGREQHWGESAHGQNKDGGHAGVNLPALCLPTLCSEGPGHPSISPRVV